MASEQEDDRAKQLEALRRYMVRLDSQWEPPAQLGVPPERPEMRDAPKVQF